MNIKIENGVTIINTGDAVGGIKNKSGHVGVFKMKGTDYYKAQIFVGKKNHFLGKFKNIEDAAAIRAEAEIHRENGTFAEWFPTLQGKTKRKRK